MYQIPKSATQGKKERQGSWVCNVGYEGAILNRIVTKDSLKMTFEPSPEGGEGMGQVDNKGRPFQGGVSR